MLRHVLLFLALACSSGSMCAPRRRREARARRPAPDLVAAKPPVPKPPSGLRFAYSACGVATAAAWTKVVVHTIRSNAPPGAIMPSSTHALFARTGVLSALPIIASAYATLSSASEVSWAELGSCTCRRLNLALVAAGVGSALWVGFAPHITQIPGSNPIASHWQAYYPHPPPTPHPTPHPTPNIFPKYISLFARSSPHITIGILPTATLTTSI